MMSSNGLRLLEKETRRQLANERRDEILLIPLERSWEVVKDLELEAVVLLRARRQLWQMNSVARPFEAMLAARDGVPAATQNLKGGRRRPETSIEPPEPLRSRILKTGKKWR